MYIRFSLAFIYCMSLAFDSIDMAVVMLRKIYCTNLCCVNVFKGVVELFSIEQHFCK